MATSKNNRTILATDTRTDRAIGRAGERGRYKVHADGVNYNHLGGDDRREANRRSRHTAREAIAAFLAEIETAEERRARIAREEEDRNARAAIDALPFNPADDTFEQAIARLNLTPWMTDEERERSDEYFSDLGSDGCHNPRCELLMDHDGGCMNDGEYLYQSDAQPLTRGADGVFRPDWY